MKVLEVSSLQEGIDQIIQRIESSFGQISAIQRAVRDFYQLDEALKGEGGKAIRHFYNECHQPFLIFLAQSLVDYQMALEKLKEAVKTFEPNHSGLIRETFLEQNVEDGLCHVKEKTEELTDEANRIIQSVEDIVSLQKIDDSEVMNNIQLGRKYAETTVEELHILDTYGVSLLKKTEENIQTMGTYLSELESKFQSGGLTIENYRVEAIQDIAFHQTIMDSIYNRKPKKTEEINAKTIENMPLSEIEKAKEAILDDLSEDGKATISIAFQKLKDGELDRQEYVGILRGIQKFEVELDKLKKKEASIEKKDHFLISALKTTGRTMKGAAIGVKDVAVDTVEGAYQMVRHPIQTGESVAQMIRNPKDTWEYMAGAITESYNRDMVNGDAESRAHWVTYALGTIIGTKGAGSAAKTGTTVTKVAKEGAKKVANEAAKVKIPNLFPYGPQYQLAPGGNIPYNVVDGLRLRDQLVMFAREITERTTKGTGETVKKIGDINDPIRTYRGADLGKLEAKYTADPRLTVEMPYVGKGEKNTNAEGWLRDKDFYWKEMLEKYPEAFNRSNRQKIELGFAPINNPTFRKHFPQYDLKELYNDTLIHHHIGGGGQAVAVPSKLHPGLGGIHNAEKSAGVWGNDQKYAELLEKFLEK
ncbi:putative ribonuclease toxin of YeeF-YezG toxin-antitoxin module [Oikeobacillus pervagus]|uniref:Ribonuclease toxin of YeeF-YezG toxin-antitoxin module n=1 Tax=Oikeobacillus pervagus TaxID=1325931 RepID=A0AAJ1WF75_9BACI|nr:T7SS effector LXG polymorphic toxin [Oikeobacillus pervagus]MDQ0213617.1 putative ribonuclease toxin of YeeF-YezG toxin-antitoxin module [Oikeobacillus pervagus]